MSFKQLTEEKKKELLEAVQRLPLALAIDLVGLPRYTTNNWLHEGEVDWNNGVDSEKARFNVEVQKAIAAGADKLITALRATGSEKAKMWLLERVHRQQFAPNADLEKALIKI